MRSLLAPLAFALLPLASGACSPSSSPTDGAATSDAGAPVDLAVCTPTGKYHATGYYHVETDCTPRLVDPDGKPFYSFGVNHVSWDGDYSPKTKTNPYADTVHPKYGTEAKWADATVARLQGWGWNTVGSWSSYASLGARMPYTVMLSLSQANWETGSIPDYFSTDWEAKVKAAAQSGTTGRVTDRNLVGYFLDNEMHWGPDWRNGYDLFDLFARLDSSAPGRAALAQFMEARYGGNLARFNLVWRQALPTWGALLLATDLGRRGQNAIADEDRVAFGAYVADRFFSVTTGAVRAADPNHLLLGVRFVATLTPIEVAAAAGKYLDVISVNAYEYVADPADVFPAEANHLVDLSAGTGAFLEPYYRLTGKPLLIGEFGYRAKDSGLPNSWPPFYPTLATQADRADRFEAYARKCFAAPWIVGYHWFEWCDEPAAGRFDGEDDNWGLVNAADEPYTPLVERTKAVNVAP